MNSTTVLPITDRRADTERAPLMVVAGKSAARSERCEELRWSLATWCWTHVRRLIILVFGVTVLALGVAMLVLPGPGLLTIFGGIAILATEFAWARWIKRYAERRVRELMALRKRHGCDEPNATSSDSRS